MKINPWSINISSPYSDYGMAKSKPEKISYSKGEESKSVCLSLTNLASINSPYIHQYDNGALLQKFALSDLRTPLQAESLLEKYPQTSRFMGSVPYSWLKNIKKEDIPDYTKLIFALFADFAKNMHCKRDDSPLNYKKQMQEYSLKLEELIGLKTKIEYLGEGTIGRTYKLSVGEENYVIKTFFTNPVKFGYYTRHGKGAEILSAVYAKYNAPKGYFADFYFGKFARNDDYDGFMITKYIDYDNAKISYLKNMLLERLIEQPIYCGNLVNNNAVLDTVVDYGEIRKGGLSNNRQYEIQKQVLSALLAEDAKKFNEICRQYKGPDLDNVLKMLSKSYNLISLSHYDDVESLSGDECKIVTSDKHNRMFKMIVDAILSGSRQRYDEIVNRNKGNPEFDYVISLYNKDMLAEEREIFARRVRKTELERLSEMLSNTGLI